MENLEFGLLGEAVVLHVEEALSREPASVTAQHQTMEEQHVLDLHRITKTVLHKLVPLVTTNSHLQSITNSRRETVYINEH